jgi:hypothetical protein
MGGLALICRGAVAGLSLLALAGCTQLYDPESTLLGLGGDRATTAGANLLFPGEVESVDLFLELDPGNRRDAMVAGGATNLCPPIQPGGDPETLFRSEAEERCANPLRQNLDQSIIQELSAAFRAFYTGYGDEDLEARRNRIQDRLLLASDHRCGLYSTYLRRFEAENEFWLGSAATVLGGLGSIFTNATVARALAGAAGITSGIRAENRQAYLSNLASEVIINGINLVRTEALREIYRIRDQQPTIEAYTVEAAVADAVRYHSLCSAYVGMAAASSSIQESANPGIETVLEMTQVTALLQDISDGNFDQAEINRVIGEITSPRAGPAITPIGTIVAANPLTDAVNQIDQVQSALETLRQAVNAAKNSSEGDAETVDGQALDGLVSRATSATQGVIDQLSIALGAAHGPARLTHLRAVAGDVAVLRLRINSAIGLVNAGDFDQAVAVFASP